MCDNHVNIKSNHYCNAPCLSPNPVQPASQMRKYPHATNELLKTVALDQQENGSWAVVNSGATDNF